VAIEERIYGAELGHVIHVAGPFPAEAGGPFLLELVLDVGDQALAIRLDPTEARRLRLVLQRFERIG